MERYDIFMSAYVDGKGNSFEIGISQVGDEPYKAFCTYAEIAEEDYTEIVEDSDVDLEILLERVIGKLSDIAERL